MSPTIGNGFPEDIRIGLAQLNFTIGAVFKFYCNKAAKPKRFIMVGLKYDQSQIALLYINSEINPNVFPTPKLQAEHIKFLSLGREYLTHDSFIDCTQLIIKDKNEIYDMLIATPEIHLGRLIPADLDLVKQKIKDSKLITNTRKKEFGLFLGGG